ncbi:MAG: type II toxin-antitoxin system RelE/ParE family toxin [Porticoccaceae bacterium]
MSYRLRFAPRAADDLQRLFTYLAERDLAAAERARDAIAKAFEFLQTFPFACRKASSKHPISARMGPPRPSAAGCCWCGDAERASICARRCRCSHAPL